MFTDFVIPLLLESLPIAEHFECLTLRTVGLGESVVEQRIGNELTELIRSGLEVGYCARPGQVDVRLAALGKDAKTLVQTAEQVVHKRLGDSVFGVGDEEMEALIVHLLEKRKLTLAMAESCTGGGIANRLTNIPGASAVFKLGLVTYSNEAKRALLQVRQETLDEHGAVSKEVAREMAEGARRVAGADYAIAVTGIAGPGGGTSDKPVGTVYIGLATSAGTVVHEMHNPWDRATFKDVTSLQALNLLRRQLAEVSHAVRFKA